MRNRLAVVALVLLIVVGLVASVQALPPGNIGHDDIYYSDASYSEVVGEYYMQCGSSPSNWGIRTAYVDSFSWDCATGGGTISGTCTTTTCTENTDANGNKWYSDCQTTTETGGWCSWKMCNDVGHCD